MPRVGRLALVLTVLTAIGCDRVTKHMAESMLAGEPARTYLGGTVWVGYAENTGGFLSLGAELPEGVRTVIFTVATGLMLLVISVYAVRQHWTGWTALGVALFVAGGASNWIDRMLRGSVVDFLNVGIGSLRTGVFNVADVAIMVGAGIFAVSEWRRSREPGQLRHAGTS